MKRTAVFTISSANYFAQAKTLLDSLKDTNPEWDRCYALVDEMNPQIREACKDIRVIRMEELPINDLNDMKFRYNVMELNTAIKPFVILYLLNEYDRVVYLDPDIYVYERMDAVNEAFDQGYNFVLTPHFTGYWDEDGKHPDEPDIMRAGVYNFGFFAARRSEDAKTAITWWADKLSTLCVNLQEQGIFVDQKWMDLLPGRHKQIYIIRDNGYNTAYWNLSHRTAVFKDGRYYFNGDKLVFFHFSGFNPTKPDVISKHQTRFAMEDIGVAKNLFEDYARKCMDNHFNDWQRFKYSYDHFSDGREINNLFRLLYREDDAVRSLISSRNPFECGKVFYSQKEKLAAPILNYICRTRKESSVYFLNTPRAAWIEWFVEVVGKEYRLGEEWTQYLRELLKNHLAGFEEDLKNYEAPPVSFGTLSPGINLIGYISSEHGVGEACRMTAKALSTTALDWNILDYEYKNPSRKQDESWRSKITDHVNYNISIFNINADQLLIAREHLPEEAWAGYRIGIWYWELGEFPDKWCDAFDCLDEIWAPTRFVRDTLQKKASCPVLYMPPGIWRDEPDAKYDRAYFGLPSGQKTFLFLNMFDVFSYTDRKNPQAVITAFQKAFQADDLTVGLVLKINNITREDENYRKIEEAIGAYRNIYVIPKTMTRDEINGLIRVCDAAVSLHRSEGLGLLCMEAMFFGKPVIATNWSGNTDFMTEDTSCLVSCKMTPVGEYYGTEGMHLEWAEADVAEASRYMQRLCSDYDYYNKIAKNAENHIRSEFSPKVCGGRMENRIREILSKPAAKIKSDAERKQKMHVGKTDPVKQINTLWSVDYNRPLEDNGSFKGIRMFVKRAIRKSLRFLVAPLFDMQREYNAAATQVMNGLISKTDELVARVERMDAMRSRQEKVNQEMMSQQRKDSEQVINKLDQMRTEQRHILQQSGSWYNALTNIYMQLEHRMTEQQAGDTVGFGLEKAVQNKWKLIDKYYREPDTFVCPICGAVIPTREADIRQSEDIFGGGKLVRYCCPSCGAVVGPNKMLDLSDEELSEEYGIHYQINVEGGSSEAEKETFMDLKPEKGKRYLNYGCGGWNDSIGELRKDGYDVWGFDPYAPNTSEHILTDINELEKMKFDGIFSHDLLEHLRNPVQTFQLFAKILKPDGLMAHSTACYKYVYEYDRFHLIFYTGNAVQVLCERTGFEVIDRIEDDDRLVYNWIYRKRKDL